ncbi:MAG: rocR [Caloramator sp.]|jgi:arginine utilization regulatory protein|uniref:sigma-54 interaction domain-containing protein n=1 Tax=Caloramator sp. TaxID=1871330 RepID=UPI001D391A4E|nr:sigma 54-interacting transcriptional regulator [Caloramator sp.]MBZ4662483.1 rocR [Caloramator sp.]
MNFEHRLLEIILNNIDEGIHVVDSDGNTLIYNRAMEQIEGLNSNEVVGKNLCDIFPNLNETTSTLLSCLKSGEPELDRYQTYLNKKGNNITTVNTTIPIVLDGKTLGAVEISKNFTKIKELYDRILQLNNNREDDLDEFKFSDIVGASPDFLKTIELAKKASRTNSTVLIIGETGTGKEVIARCIHSSSQRNKKPFIAVNCAALPESLLEGILFGTVKGSFTGAINRPGLFEQANGGTLLLDEINSMPVNLQAKLLRVLQEGYIRRIGDVRDIPIDVRIIATINEDPYTSIIQGNLRKDLYYRLSVININIPPLRDRKEDIPIFINQFIKKYNTELIKDVWEVSDEVYDGFLSYDWPGNVRELKNYIEGAMNMVTGHILKREHFAPNVQELIFKRYTSKISDLKYDFNVPLDDYLEDIEKSIILTALERTNYNISKAAGLLKIKRQTLQHKLNKYGINK